MWPLVAIGESGVDSIEAFKAWTRSAIRPVFSHAMLLSVYARLDSRGVSVNYMVPVDVPLSALPNLRARTGALDTPLFRRFATTREPQFLGDMALHGEIDDAHSVASYHSFYRIAAPPGEREILLRRVVPVLHRVLCRVVEPAAEPLGGSDGACLSPRENLIADGVLNGSTNAEIAALHGLSENTVKHHLTSIFAKLGVKSRAQLARRLGRRASSVLP